MNPNDVKVVRVMHWIVYIDIQSKWLITTIYITSLFFITWTVTIYGMGKIKKQNMRYSEYVILYMISCIMGMIPSLRTMYMITFYPERYIFLERGKNGVGIYHWDISIHFIMNDMMADVKIDYLYFITWCVFVYGMQRIGKIFVK